METDDKIYRSRKLRIFKFSEECKNGVLLFAMWNIEIRFNSIRGQMAMERFFGYEGD